MAKTVGRIFLPAPGRRVTSDHIFFLFLGLPLSILGMGLRRALGAKRMGLLLLGASFVAIYDLLLEAGLRRIGHGFPLPAAGGAGMLRGLGLFTLGGALLGALGGVLMRFRGRGSL